MQFYKLIKTSQQLTLLNYWLVIIILEGFLLSVEKI